MMSLLSYQIGAEALHHLIIMDAVKADITEVMSVARISFDQRSDAVDLDLYGFIVFHFSVSYCLLNEGTQMTQIERIYGIF